MTQGDKKSKDGGSDSPPNHNDPPDERGERPSDANELAAWIVEQTTNDDADDEHS